MRKKIIMIEYDMSMTLQNVLIDVQDQIGDSKLFGRIKIVFNKPCNKAVAIARIIENDLKAV